jgi:hypothetical protein
VGEYKKTMSGLRRDYTELKQQEEHAALIEDPASEQRNRLMSANTRLERGSDRIKYALEVVGETESTALEINDELNRNREKIEGIHARVIMLCCLLVAWVSHFQLLLRSLRRWTL